MRLLLIEDDLMIASFVSKGLKEAGFVVEHASEGKSLLKQRKPQPPPGASSPSGTAL